MTNLAVQMDSVLRQQPLSYSSLQTAMPRRTHGMSGRQVDRANWHHTVPGRNTASSRRRRPVFHTTERSALANCCPDSCSSWLETLTLLQHDKAPLTICLLHHDKAPLTICLHDKAPLTICIMHHDKAPLTTCLLHHDKAPLTICLLHHDKAPLTICLLHRDKAPLTTCLLHHDICSHRLHLCIGCMRRGLKMQSAENCWDRNQWVWWLRRFRHVKYNNWIKQFKTMKAQVRVTQRAKQGGGGVIFKENIKSFGPFRHDA